MITNISQRNGRKNKASNANTQTTKEKQAKIIVSFMNVLIECL